MKNWRAGVTLAVIAGVSALLIMGNASPSPRSRALQTEATQDSQVLLGNDFAKSLGLSPITTFPVTDCHYFAEARDLRTREIFAYCLDSVVSDDLAFTKMAIMFKGRSPTSVDKQIFDLQEQLSQMSDDQSFDAQRATVAAEIMSLQASDRQLTRVR